MPPAALRAATVERVSPDRQALRRARELVEATAFTDCSCVVAPPRLFAVAGGYDATVDLADPLRPTARCGCAARRVPCPHALGLMLLYAEAPGRFAERAAAGR